MSSPTHSSPAATPVSLTERRKAETRREIARAAAGLFVKHGLRATRAEDIAQAAGIAPRTFYRYFATKEESIAPLYAAGAQLWTEAVRDAPAGLSLPQALEHAVRHTLMPGAGVSAATWEWVRTLIRLAESSPGLRKVWAEVCQTEERALAEVLMERRARLAQDDGAARLAQGDDNVAESPAPARVPTPTPTPAPSPSPTPDLRFAAAVASAAVRTAVDAWVSGEAVASGPEGPAALALRNLAALGEFPWDGPA